jgi:predicted dehydrogenase
VNKKIRFGVLGAASIAVESVIPAMQKSNFSEVTAIASRNLEKAKTVSQKLNIKKYYGSYEELLADKEIDAIYNPLPNHLHVPWSVKALEAGKHVLCEKPIALNAAQAQELLTVSKKFPRLKITEAFMYRFHPQWIKTKTLIAAGEIGELQTIQTFFSYFDNNPESIVNIKEFGGGAMPDIGCYPVSLSRYIFNKEPKKVSAHIIKDPVSDVDILSSGILVFNNGTSTFTTSIRSADFQRVNIFGTLGEIEIEIPFNAPNHKPTNIYLKKAGKTQKIKIEICDQYGIEADEFAKTILENRDVDYPLEDALKQMQIIDAIYSSAEKNKFIEIEEKK